MKDSDSAYAVLGLSDSPSEDDIRGAFNEQVRQFHPDQFDPEELDVSNVEELDPDDLFRDIQQARDKLQGDVRTVSLNYEWDNGEPVNSGGADESIDEEARTGETGTSGDDSTWDTDNPQGGSGIDDTSEVNIDGESDNPDDDTNTETVTLGHSNPRRRLLKLGGIGVGTIVVGDWLGVTGFFSNTIEQVRTVEEAVLTPEDNIQEELQRVAAGGTLSLEDGTYNQRVTIDKDLTVTGAGRAILAGGGTDGPGITIGDADVTLDTLTIGGFGTGIYSDGGGSVELSNVAVGEISGVGVNLTCEEIYIKNQVVERIDGTGLILAAPADGTITIDELVSQNNENPGVGAYTEGRGLQVKGGKEVVINKATIRNTGNEGVLIAPPNQGPQTVEITDSQISNAKSRDGVVIQGSNEPGTVRLSNVEITDNEYKGLVIGSENQIGEGVFDSLTISDNNGTGMYIQLTESGTFSLRGSNFKRNEDDGIGFATDGHGLNVVDGQQFVVEDTKIAASGHANLLIGGQLGQDQSVELNGVDVSGSAGRSGIRYHGTGGKNSIVIKNCEATQNDDYGFELAGESVQIENTQASENGDGPLQLKDIERDTATITNSF